MFYGHNTMVIMLSQRGLIPGPPESTSGILFSNMFGAQGSFLATQSTIVDHGFTIAPIDRLCSVYNVGYKLGHINHTNDTVPVMSDSESNPTSSSTGSKQSNALELGPRKKPCHTDPLVHHGRHFCRTVHALCNIDVLLTNGISRITEQADDDLTMEEQCEQKICQALLDMIPGLQERLTTGSEDEVAIVAELIQKGMSGARGDDTKSLKGAVLEWITPKGQALNPPIA